MMPSSLYFMNMGMCTYMCFDGQVSGCGKICVFYTYWIYLTLCLKACIYREAIGFRPLYLCLENFLRRTFVVFLGKFVRTRSWVYFCHWPCWLFTFDPHSYVRQAMFVVHLSLCSSMSWAALVDFCVGLFAHMPQPCRLLMGWVLWNLLLFMLQLCRNSFPPGY